MNETGEEWVQHIVGPGGVIKVIPEGDEGRAYYLKPGQSLEGVPEVVRMVAAIVWGH